VPPPVRINVPTLKRSEPTPPPVETSRKRVDTTPPKHTDEPTPRHVEKPTGQAQRTTTTNRSSGGGVDVLGAAMAIGGMIAGGLALGHGHGGGGGGGGGPPMHSYGR